MSTALPFIATPDSRHWNRQGFPSRGPMRVRKEGLKCSISSLFFYIYRAEEITLIQNNAHLFPLCCYKYDENYKKSLLQERL